MEVEALLLGLEPMAALAVGVGALLVVPALGAVGDWVGKETAAGTSLSESGRNIAKNSLIWGMDVFDNTISFFAEAGESFQDLVAEARAERNIAKARAENKYPRTIRLL